MHVMSRLKLIAVVLVGLKGAAPDAPMFVKLQFSELTTPDITAPANCIAGSMRLETSRLQRIELVADCWCRTSDVTGWRPVTTTSSKRRNLLKRFVARGLGRWRAKQCQRYANPNCNQHEPDDKAHPWMKSTKERRRLKRRGSRRPPVRSGTERGVTDPAG
jgi:hypothetical protein